jgi:hypothetical protein
VLKFAPFKHFDYLVEMFVANHWGNPPLAWNHFICIAYAQITRSEGLGVVVDSGAACALHAGRPYA